MDPGRVGDDLALLVLLRILAQLPDVPVVVLCEERELGLDELAGVEVAVPEDHGAHARDLLREVGHREDDPVGEAFLAFGREAGERQLCPRLHRQPRVVHVRGTREVAGVEVLCRDGGRLHLAARAGGRQPHRRRDEERHHRQ